MMEKEHDYFLIQLEMDLLAALPDCEWRFDHAAKLMIKAVYQASKLPFDFEMHTRRWFRQGMTILATGPLAHLPVSQRDYSACNLEIEKTLRDLATELDAWRTEYRQRKSGKGEKTGRPVALLDAINKLVHKRTQQTVLEDGGITSKHFPIAFFTEDGQSVTYDETIFRRLAESCVENDFDVRPPDAAIQKVADEMSSYFMPENDMGTYDEDLDRCFTERFNEVSLRESGKIKASEAAEITADDPFGSGMTLGQLADSIESENAANKENELDLDNMPLEKVIVVNAMITCSEMLRKYRQSEAGRAAASANEKADEIHYFDDARYRSMEDSVNAHAHTEPSVARTVALFGTLQAGFKAAYQPPVDLELAKAKWLSACLELLSVDPLRSSHNDWKHTLSVPDNQMISRAFSSAASEITRWQDAVMATEPLVDVEVWGELVEAIHNYFVIGHTVKEDGRLCLKITDDMILSKNIDGNLRINDRIILGLLGVCETHDAAALYRQMKIPENRKMDIDIANTGVEFGSFYICQQGDAQIRLCHKFLEDRIAAYHQTEDESIKRAILAFEPGLNKWFDFYVREYCTPTLYHVKQVKSPKINLTEYVENFNVLDQMSDQLCQLVLVDSHHSAEAQKMYSAWKDLRATFAVRNLYKATPTYEQQVAFCTKLSEFMELFTAAAKTIDLAKVPGRKKSAKEKAKFILDAKQNRFSYSKGYFAIRDDEHTPPEYKIDTYEGIEDGVAKECIKTLINAMGNKKTDGWVKVPPQDKVNWRGAFPRKNAILYRFKNEQIEVGRNNTEHQGYWRIIIPTEFDQKSTKGKFHKAVQ